MRVLSSSHRCPAGHYPTETAFMEDMRDMALSCTRHYFITEWYSRFKRAHGGLPGEYTGEPVPTWDAKHDEHVLAVRAARKHK